MLYFFDMILLKARCLEHKVAELSQAVAVASEGRAAAERSELEAELIELRPWLQRAREASKCCTFG